MRFTKVFKLLFAAAAFAFAGFAAAQTDGVLKPLIAPGEHRINAAWQPFSFAKMENKTSYTVHKGEGERTAIRATANGGASALMHTVNVQAADAPVLRWAWNVQKSPEGSDAKVKAGDDYAARVYVAFAYDPEKVPLLLRAQYGLIRAIYGQYPPFAALAYIVEPRLPEGTIINSPYTSRVKMIVVDSGKTPNQWRSFQRNVLADYARAFGEPPVTAIAGVAIMTDADNTGGVAEALYDSIRLAAQ